MVRVSAALASAAAPGAPLTALLILLLHGPVLFVSGVRMGGDSASYVYWAQRLVDSGFDYPTLLREANTGFPALLYALFVSLIALLRLAFGAHWPAALVMLNLAGHVAVGTMLVRLSVRVTGKGAAGWAALLLFLGCYDALSWVPFILSDTTFLFLVFLTFFLAARRVLGVARSWITVLPTAAAALFYRPTGIVLVPDLAWAIYLSRTRNVPLRGRALAGLALIILGTAAIFAWLMQDSGRWPLDSLANAFARTSHDYQLGAVVFGRPETFHAPPANLLDYMLISADRFIHFFAIGAVGFSLGHWVAALLFFVPCYLLSGWMLISLWRGDDALEEGGRRVLLFAVGAILSYALFHGLVQVDFDWRYRVPILPHLMLLAAAGAADLTRRAGAR
jgi:hypothetical protein